MYASYDTSGARARVSLIGFACNQGLLYVALFGMVDDRNAYTDIPFQRISLFVVLVCLIVVFLLLRRGSDSRWRMLSAPQAPWLCAAALEVAILLLTVLQANSLAVWELGVLAQGLLMGVPAALLLCLWGQVLGTAPIEQSVPEVFIGSALGAALCFVVNAVPVTLFNLLFCLLPVGSAWCLGRLRVGPQPPGSINDPPILGNGSRVNAASAPFTVPSADGAQIADSDDAPGVGSLDAKPADEAHRLSRRVLIGTAVFGAAAGVLEATLPQMAAQADNGMSITLLLFIFYCLAAMQLFGGSGIQPVKAVFGTGNAVGDKDNGPLDGAYRLSVLLMVGGFLLIPLLSAWGIAPQSVVLAGYLAVASVFVSLFLVMGRIGLIDAGHAFAQGFAVFFCGQAVGLLLGNGFDLIDGWGWRATWQPVAFALAGIATLYAYLFLFTDHDMASLSLVVQQTDRFQKTCETVIAQFGLSRRESEILPMVLRGRTSERIAQELFITKNTVDTHIRRIYGKCGVHSRQELIDLAEQMEARL